MTRRHVTAVLAVLALTVAPLVEAAPASASTRTSVSNVSPIKLHTARIKNNYKVVKNLHGTCDTGSSVVTGALRCIVENYIHDPCWNSTTNSDEYSGIVCLATPWSHSLVRVLAHDTSGIAPTRGRTLWGLQTSTGLRCSYAAGTHDIYKGKPVNYYCSKYVWLVGSPSLGKTWHIIRLNYTHGYKIKSARRVAIKHAWFGVSPLGA